MENEMDKLKDLIYKYAASSKKAHDETEIFSKKGLELEKLRSRAHIALYEYLDELCEKAEMETE